MNKILILILGCFILTSCNTNNITPQSETEVSENTIQEESSENNEISQSEDSLSDTDPSDKENDYSVQKPSESSEISQPTNAASDINSSFGSSVQSSNSAKTTDTTTNKANNTYKDTLSEEEIVKIMWDEIAVQPFYDSIILHMDSKNGKIYVKTKGSITNLENFLADKPYKNDIVIVRWEETPYGKWKTGIEKERNISNWNAFNRQISELKNMLENSLNDTVYGGIEEIKLSFTDPQTGETYSDEVGIRVYHTDSKNAKTVVEKCLKNIDQSVGKIDIEYVNCDHSLSELKKIESEIEKQDFYKKGIQTLDIFGGKIYITVKSEGDGEEIENFLKDKKYKDSVVVKLLQNVPNPLT